MSSLQEQAVSLPGPTGPMLGILSLPPGTVALSGTAVVLVVGGAQYRVGSHRQFVRLARALARQGHSALRFDFPGMGDSPGEPVPFEATAPHVAAAVDRAMAVPGVQRVVLWGLCDGASACLLYQGATGDTRIAGMALLNPWVRSEASLARAQVRHYYRQRLLEVAFWRKLFNGAVGRQALSDLWRNLRLMRAAQSTALPPTSFQDRMAGAWRDFPGAVLLLLSERDLTAQEFVEYANTQPRWKGWALHPRLEQHQLAGADHTCSRPADTQQSETLVLNWLQQLS